MAKNRSTARIGWKLLLAHEYLQPGLTGGVAADLRIVNVRLCRQFPSPKKLATQSCTGLFCFPDYDFPCVDSRWIYGGLSSVTKRLINPSSPSMSVQ